MSHLRLIDLEHLICRLMCNLTMIVVGSTEEVRYLVDHAFYLAR
jgi:hypothetical protein